MATVQHHRHKITPSLWFNDNAEEAVSYYVSVFKNAEKVKMTHYEAGGAMPEGSVLAIQFEIEGKQFLAFNGGPSFDSNEAISLVVNCETQEEIDFYWDILSEGGKKGDCGWIEDRFGVSWQVVPKIISEMLTDKDPEKAARVMEAIMMMKKLDIKTLKEAFNNEHHFAYRP